jgi:hypothetical protein
MDWTAMGLWVDSWQRQLILLLQSTETPTYWVLSPGEIWQEGEEGEKEEGEEEEGDV